MNIRSDAIGHQSMRPRRRQYLNGLRADEVVLGIHHREHGHVGNIKYGPIDWDNRSADISIMIGEPAVWGQGVGAEAVYLVNKYLFEECGLQRIDAGTRNPAFVALVKKLGWTVEGVLQAANSKRWPAITIRYCWPQLADDFVRDARIRSSRGVATMSPLRSIALVANAQVRFLMMDIARELRARHGSDIHLYCATAQERSFYDAHNADKAFHSVGLYEPLLDNALRPVADPDAEIAAARANEARLGAHL